MSPTQERVLRFLAAQSNNSGQIAGYGRAPWLSAAHALQRKGLVNSYRTGRYYLTKAGIQAIKGSGK